MGLLKTNDLTLQPFYITTLGRIQWLSGLTFTNKKLVVVDKADGALAPETANHVDAHSILTHPWDFSALVDV